MHMMQVKWHVILTDGREFYEFAETARIAEERVIFGRCFGRGQVLETRRA